MHQRFVRRMAPGRAGPAPGCAMAGWRRRARVRRQPRWQTIEDSASFPTIRAALASEGAGTGIEA